MHVLILSILITDIHVLAPTLSISEVDYNGIENVTVTVEWIEQIVVLGVRYSVNVTPWAPLMANGTASYRVTIPYNTEYNFSVAATAPCRSNATVTVFITLHYGEDNS